MQKRKIGNLEVSAIGMGCMNLSGNTGTPATKEYGIKTIRYAYDKGITFLIRRRLMDHISTKN